MKILLELDVDDALGREYEHLAPENKLQFKNAVCQMMQKTAANIRSKKLKKLLDELRRDPKGHEFDPEILYAIIRKEEY